MFSENNNVQKQESVGKDDIVRTQFDYAWKWFEYHAKQRISMFNYFLLASGILANAYVCLIKEKYFILAMGLAIVGALISFAFVILDFRNAQLVYRGEYVIRRIERNLLFPKGSDGLDEKGCGTSEGILLRDLNCIEKKWAKHKFWLKFIEFLMVVFFLAAFSYACFIRCK